MNEKLKITPTEYQHKIRKQAKARTIKFRQAQEARGYKNLTIYLSKPFRAELERLADDKGLNRQDAMDHIFEVYQRHVNVCVTSNVTLSRDKSIETSAIPEPSPDPKIKGSKKANKIEGQVQDVEKKTAKKQNEMFNDPPKPETLERETEAYSKWLFDKIDPLRRSGMSSVKIEKKLNDEGVKPYTKSKNKFKRNSAASFHDGRLKVMGQKWDNKLKEPVPLDKTE